VSCIESGHCAESGCLTMHQEKEKQSPEIRTRIHITRPERNSQNIEYLKSDYQAKHQLQ
jgi:hypothetical protein